ISFVRRRHRDGGIPRLCCPGSARWMSPHVVHPQANAADRFTGAIARNGQSFCLGFSLRLALFCGPALALGILVQRAPVPFAREWKAMRITVWTASWLVWLLAGPASLLHALS